MVRQLAVLIRITLGKDVTWYPPEGHFSCFGKKSTQKKPPQGGANRALPVAEEARRASGSGRQMPRSLADESRCRAPQQETLERDNLSNCLLCLTCYPDFKPPSLENPSRPLRDSLELRDRSCYFLFLSLPGSFELLA